MIIKIRRFDAGQTDVMIERSGYSHTQRNVTPASIARIEKLVTGAKREFTRKYDAATTTIKM